MSNVFTATAVHDKLSAVLSRAPPLYPWVGCLRRYAWVPVRMTLPLPLPCSIRHRRNDSGRPCGSVDDACHGRGRRYSCAVAASCIERRSGTLLARAGAGGRSAEDRRSTRWGTRASKAPDTRGRRRRRRPTDAPLSPVGGTIALHLFIGSWRQVSSIFLFLLVGAMPLVRRDSDRNAAT